MNTHRQIQKNLLLYLDAELQEKEMQEIRGHLSGCAACSEEYELLKAVWKREERPEATQPPPYLWTRLAARIREYEQSPIWLWDVRALFGRISLHPISSMAVVLALAAGIYLGMPQSSDHSPEMYKESLAVRDELGLDLFDIVPPDALGSEMVTSNAKK